MQSEWVRVSEAAHALEANLWAGLLAQFGIESRLVGGTLSAAVGELPTDVMAVEVWVPALQHARALAILEELHRPKSEWRCQHCHELNDGQFELCWQCGNEQ
ncbi:DUF2007 domain-containing protein [Thaumasiovibrio subtropicus]|uniref:putative signal transducing protein n=1 Tax=Thaumasiovibrio subtropicus TaxID=1891207 RepID=UPI000B35A410|nr:DUF2007 domain-containing protein [Thaumasiovibrio subtropicus]